MYHLKVARRAHLSRLNYLNFCVRKTLRFRLNTDYQLSLREDIRRGFNPTENQLILERHLPRFWQKKNKMLTAVFRVHCVHDASLVARGSVARPTPVRDPGRSLTGRRCRTIVCRGIVCVLLVGVRVHLAVAANAASTLAGLPVNSARGEFGI